MKLNEAKIKKKRHKSLDPWRLYVPDWSRTSGLLLRSSLRNVVASGSIILTVAFNSGNTGKSLCSFWKLIN